MRGKKILQTDRVISALFRYRFLITVFLLVALFFVGGASAAEYTADTTANFTANLSTAVGGDTIIITGDFTISNVTIDKEITIRSDTPHTLTASSDRLFYITSTGHLILDDDVTLTNGSADYGGAVCAGIEGKFTMNGGNISGNHATADGGGVYVTHTSILRPTRGTFTMNGGTIVNNTAGQNGGGVCVRGNDVFTMSGGTISGNHATNSGGGVILYAGHRSTMSGGTIVNNTAGQNGGGVLMAAGIFNMSGSSAISDNTVTGNGGGVWMDLTTFNMTGGNISRNIATDYGGGVYMSSGIFGLKNGNVSGNTATRDGGGFYVSGGDFNIAGPGSVDADNSVFLKAGRYLTVTGDLDTDAGTQNIISGYTVNGTVLVKYGSLSIPDTWNSNFALNTTWANQYSFLLINTSRNLVLILNCTVNFYNETDVVYATQYVLSGSNITEPSPIPTKTGYTFNGWNNTTSGVDNPWNFSTDRVTVNPTNLSANWTANTYNISYLNNGGSGTITNQSVTFNTTVILNNGSSLSRAGYTLANWTTLPDGGTSYAVNGTYGTYDVADNLTLYANWTKIVTQYSSGTTGKGTSITLVFRVNKSILEEKNLTSDDIAVLHYINGNWDRVMSTSIQLIDGVYLFTVITSDGASPFMVAYNVDGTWIELEVEEEVTPTPTATTGSTVIVPTSTTNPTKTPSSPVPLVGIIAGLGAVTLLLRRR